MFQGITNKSRCTLIFLSFFIFTACKDNSSVTNQSQEINNQEAIEDLSENKNSARKNILFFGNSLTAGLGLSESETFPYLIQKRIDSLGLNYQVINAGVSGETTSGGLERIEWVLSQPVEIFVLELGANDMLRGLDVTQTRENLDKILEKVKGKYPEAQLIIAGMQAAPNMGPNYIEKFNQIYPALAEEHQAILIPFFLDKVAGVEHLNQDDLKHPNARGMKIVMENVWDALQPIL